MKLKLKRLRGMQAAEWQKWVKQIKEVPVTPLRNVLPIIKLCLVFVNVPNTISQAHFPLAQSMAADNS